MIRQRSDSLCCSPSHSSLAVRDVRRRNRRRRRARRLKRRSPARTARARNQSRRARGARAPAHRAAALSRRRPRARRPQPPRARRPDPERAHRPEAHRRPARRARRPNSAPIACLQLARDHRARPGRRRNSPTPAWPPRPPRARDPQRIAKLIDDLADPIRRRPQRRPLRSRRRRRTGRRRHARSTRPAKPIPSAARRSPPPSSAMDPLAVDPLLGMLSTTDPALRRDVIRILKAMHVTLAKPFIVGRASTASAERLLDDAIGRNKHGMRPFATDENDTVALWHWDDADEEAQRRPATRSTKPKPSGPPGSRMEYARLRPDERLAQCQALVLGLEADALTGGRPSPAIDQAARRGRRRHAQHGPGRRDEAQLPARRGRRRRRRSASRGDAGVLYAVSPQPVAARRRARLSRIAASASPPSRRS